MSDEAPGGLQPFHESSRPSRSRAVTRDGRLLLHRDPDTEVTTTHSQVTSTETHASPIHEPASAEGHPATASVTAAGATVQAGTSMVSDQDVQNTQLIDALSVGAGMLRRAILYRLSEETSNTQTLHVPNGASDIQSTISTDIPSDEVGPLEIPSQIVARSNQHILRTNTRRSETRLEASRSSWAMASRERQMPLLTTAGSTRPLLLSTAMSVPNPLTQTSMSTEEAGVSWERSTAARFDLERALRDYRVARRTFRNHFATDAGPVLEQSAPSAHERLARYAERQSDNINRVRAIGERTAAVLSQADAVVGNANVRDTIIARNMSNTGDNTLRSLVSSSATGIAHRHDPWLGPTPNTEGANTVPGGMRDFFQRMEAQNRSWLGPSLRSGTDDTSYTSSNRNPLNPEERRQRTSGHSSHLNDIVNSMRAKLANSSSAVSKNKARNVLRYLSTLKTAGDDTHQGLEFAKGLGIDDLADSLERGRDVDLPLCLGDLPITQYSSWLTAEMSWEGVQQAELAPPEPEYDAPGEGDVPRGAFLMRTRRYREMIRDEITSRRQNRENDVENGSSTIIAEDVNRDTRLSSLADIEQHLSDLLDEEERRLNRNGDFTWRGGGTMIHGPTSAQPEDKTSLDPYEVEWPVEVHINDVDWEKMTLTGTIAASRIKAASSVNDHEGVDQNSSGNRENLEMETVFDGEIIDFRTHELETVSGKSGYKIGGLLVDLEHWSCIGPFKDVIDREVEHASAKKARQFYQKMGISGTLEEQRTQYRRTFGEEASSQERLDADTVDKIVYDALTRCLSSRKWLEKSIGEGGWILMRWKERYFARPSASDEAAVRAGEHGRFRTIIHRRAQPQAYTLDYTDENHPDNRGAWDLTISGFYYVAMHRMSGRIDALYYDPNSQPFQALFCHPVGSEFENDKAVCGSLGEIGIRRSFGAIEFR